MGDNAFLGPVAQGVSSASNDLERLLSQAPRGLLQGPEGPPSRRSRSGSWDEGFSFCLLKASVQVLQKIVYSAA